MKNNGGRCESRKDALRILRHKGYEMATAKTGTEGIAGAERAVMNAALADLKLPKIELTHGQGTYPDRADGHEGYGIFLVGGAQAALQHHKRLEAPAIRKA